MVTRIPQIKVSRVEAGGGFIAVCDCGWRALRSMRYPADEAAIDHQASHGHPNAEDNTPDLDWDNLDLGSEVG